MVRWNKWEVNAKDRPVGCFSGIVPCHKLLTSFSWIVMVRVYPPDGAAMAHYVFIQIPEACRCHKLNLVNLTTDYLYTESIVRGRKSEPFFSIHLFLNWIQEYKIYNSEISDSIFRFHKQVVSYVCFVKLMIFLVLYNKNRSIIG